jgi:transcriptional antiterminator NusG
VDTVSQAESQAESQPRSAETELESVVSEAPVAAPEAEGVASAPEAVGSGPETDEARPQAQDEETQDAASQPETVSPGPETSCSVEAGVEPALEPAPESATTKQWFVIHTYSGHENKVKANLERAISSQGMQPKFGQVLVATEDFAEMKDGKKTITKRKTFPSYVLIEMDMSNETRHLVTNIPGVTGFVGTGREPIPLRVEEVRRVLGLDAEGKVAKPTPSVPFKIGEHVKVVDGPFSDFTGIVDEVNSERGKVKVMVSIFGRATPVELDFLQVQSI